MPERQEKQATRRAVVPLGQDSAQHGHALHVRHGTGGVMVAEREGVEAGPGGGQCLFEHGPRTQPVVTAVKGRADGDSYPHGQPLSSTRRLSTQDARHGLEPYS